MKVAISVWQGRISPVLDEANCLVLVELQGSREVRRVMRTLPDMELWKRVREITQMGIQVLICGAISRPLEIVLSEMEIIIFSRICGSVEEVLSAFIKGQLDNDEYTLPGCNKRRRQQREEHPSPRRKET